MKYCSFSWLGILFLPLNCHIPTHFSRSNSRVISSLEPPLNISYRRDKSFPPLCSFTSLVTFLLSYILRCLIGSYLHSYSHIPCIDSIYSSKSSLSLLCPYLLKIRTMSGRRGLNEIVIEWMHVYLCIYLIIPSPD